MSTLLVGIWTVCIMTTVAKYNEDHKRLVLHGEGDIAATIQIMSTQMAELTSNITVMANDLAETKKRLESTTAALNQTQTSLAAATAALSSHGSTFTRWGRTTCPNDTDMVYKGYTAGSSFHESGGAAEFICATDDPIWGHYDDSRNAWTGHMYGTEYQFGEQSYHNGGADFFGQHLFDHDAPCCVCRATLPTTIMIPGRNHCFQGWTLQYAGYLVSTYATAAGRSSYICLDFKPEVEAGDVNDANGALLYTVEAMCGSLKCPPYIQYREVTCAVCSK